MFNSPIHKTQDQLVQAARAATTDYITNGTDLTEAVVKAASAITPVTSEHVRRICEMTYHDAYERMFAEKTGMYQYVSFDPPDAIRASEMLDALQLGFNNQANFGKLAAAPSSHTKEANYGKKIKDAFDSYMTAMSGSNIAAQKKGVNAARDVFNASKQTVSNQQDTIGKINLSIKGLKKQQAVFNDEYNNTADALTGLYSRRKQVLSHLGLPFKPNKDTMPDLSKMNQSDLGHIRFAIPDIENQVNSAYDFDSSDAIAMAKSTINRVKDDQKIIKGHLQNANTQLSDAKKQLTSFKQSLTEAKKGFQTAQQDLHKTQSATTRARVGTGIALTVPAGIYGVKRMDNPNRNKKTKDHKKQAAGFWQAAGDTVRDASTDFLNTISGRRLREARMQAQNRADDVASWHAEHSREGLNSKGLLDRGRKLQAGDTVDADEYGYGYGTHDAVREYTKAVDAKDMIDQDVLRERNMMLGAQAGTGALALGGAVGMGGIGIGAARGKQPAPQQPKPQQPMPMQKRASVSMPRKFQRMNTHELWTKAASGTELQDHNPTRSVQQIHRDLKDSISTVKSELYSAEHNEKLAMIDMVKQAKAGLSAGHSMEQVLHAAVSVVDATEPFMAKTAHDLCATIIEACADHQNSGFSKTAKAFSQSEYDKTINWYKGQLKKNPNNKAMRKDYESLVANKSSLVKKEAAALQEVNTNHPIPQKFKKLAEANIQRKHLEVTLDELNKNLNYFNEKLVDELTR